jgi:SDR family mycofactocin-dependent oxidoreductase
MGKLDGKVAFITGAARGQGRSHAAKLAEEGADIVAVDICRAVETVPYIAASADDLAETLLLVEKTGCRALGVEADIRSSEQLDEAVARARETFGHIDILVCNAGIWSLSNESWTLDDETWQTMLDVNLTGQWKTTKAVIPAMIEQGTGGAITITSSSVGLKATTGNIHYASAKHGVIGLVRTLAHELAPYGIRCNAVCPSSVDTVMVTNDTIYDLFRPDLERPTFEDCEDILTGLNMMPVAMLSPRDVSNAISWLVSDEARYVTGIALPVDAGSTAK